MDPEPTVTAIHYVIAVPIAALIWTVLAWIGRNL